MKPRPKHPFFTAAPVILAFVLLGGVEDARAEDGVVRIAFAGDIMLDTLPGEDIAAGHDPFAGFGSVLDAADIRIGNLECVVATTGTAVDKPFTFRAHPRVLSVLRRHFTAVSLANNHTGDFGHAAFLQQLDLLKSRKLFCFGGGRNVSEARTPLVLTRNGLRIAFLGYNDFKPREFEAGPEWPGVAWAVDEQIAADIKAARTRHRADIVIPFMHWGWEHEKTSSRQRKLAHLMIDNGADLVVGSHPHVTQGAEYYKGRLIAYSLGNFLFDGFTTPEANIGWVLRLTLTKSGLQEWDTVVAQIDARGRPHVVRNVESPCGKAGSPKVMKHTAVP
ncbi:MAG: CapA family protein [Verrucomicrobiaceae bacterium]|nr:CapA family protein [Verrucomicrobiaceae bacterium]